MSTYFASWVRPDPDAETRLHAHFSWLITRALPALYGNPAGWSGTWTPSTGGGPVPYPTVEDYLTQLLQDDPVAYGHFRDDYLIPWNLA